MKTNSPLYVLTFITILTIVFGASISLVHYLSLPRLKSNETMFRNRSIARAFSLTVEPPTSENFQKAIADQITRSEIGNQGAQLQLFIRKAQPNEVGFVFKGMGFWDMIQGIIVLSPDLKHIVSIEFLDQKETPGLGARIEEPWFKVQFKRFPVAWERPSPSRIMFNQKTADGKVINAITGATQTSSALERILNSEMERFFAMYKTHQQQTGVTVK